MPTKQEEEDARIEEMVGRFLKAAEDIAGAVHVLAGAIGALAVAYRASRPPQAAPGLGQPAPIGSGATTGAGDAQPARIYTVGDGIPRPAVSQEIGRKPRS